MPIQLVGVTSGSGTGESYAISLSGTLTGGLASSPTEDDVVFVFTGFGHTASVAPTCSGNVTGAYTGAHAALHGNDTWDTEFRSFYAVQGATPDSTLTIGRVSNAAYGGATVVVVLRGVDAAVLDATTTTAAPNNANGSRADAPAITPVTAGAWVIAAGAGTQGTGGSAFTVPSGMTSLRSVNSDGTTSDLGVWAAYFEWTSGPYDPAAATGGATSTSSSWAAASLAIKPAPNAPIDAAFNDSSTPSDSTNSSLVLGDTVTESTSGSSVDTPAASASMPATRAETSAPADTPAAGNQTASTIAESAAPADTPTAGIALTSSTAETSAPADLQTAVSLALATRTETSAAVDSSDSTAGSAAKVEISWAHITSLLEAQYVESASAVDQSSASSASKVEVSWVYVNSSLQADNSETTTVVDVVDATVAGFEEADILESSAPADLQTAVSLALATLGESQASADTSSASSLLAAALVDSSTAADTSDSTLEAAPESQVVVSWVYVTSALDAEVAESTGPVDSQGGVSSGGEASCVETTSTLDTSVSVLLAVASRAETSTPADTLASTASMPATRAETSAPADTLASTASMPATRAETSAPADTPAGVKDTAASTSESATPSDAYVGATSGSEVICVESTTATDSTSSTWAGSGAFAEVSTLADTESAGNVTTSSRVETTTAADTVTGATPQLAGSVQESTAPEDTVSSTFSFRGASTSESTTAQDTSATAGDAAGDVAESTLAADTASGLNAGVVSVVESTATVDTITPQNVTDGVSSEQATPADQCGATVVYASEHVAESTTSLESSLAYSFSNEVTGLFEEVVAEDTISCSVSAVSAVVEQATTLDDPFGHVYDHGAQVYEVTVSADSLVPAVGATPRWYKVNTNDREYEVPPSSRAVSVDGSSLTADV